MTGGGPGRDAPDDARQRGPDRKRDSTWRGTREEPREAPIQRPGAFGDSWIGRAEIEELPAQPVLPRGSPRFGVGGTLAIVAIVALVAAGFGALGGRPEASFRAPTMPLPSGVGPGPSMIVPVPATAPVTPMVTPWAECSGPFDGPVEVVLQVDGRPVPGSVEIVSLSYHPQSPDPSAGVLLPPPFHPTRVDVPIDVITEMWIDGGACAVAWNIDLVGGATLESRPNREADPAYAAQNRFEIVVAPYDSGDHDLRAVLVFPSFVARVTWPIRILPFDPPVASFHWGEIEVPTVEGCGLHLTLGNSWQEDLNPCTGDIGAEPGAAVPVRSVDRPSFEIEGWTVQGLMMLCGHLSGRSFVAQPEPGCAFDAQPDGILDSPPAEPGPWTLAISACAGQFTASTSNRLCGTWFANVDVRE